MWFRKAEVLRVRYGEPRGAPPGSETTTCLEGFPRNLGDPVVSVESRGGSRDNKPRPLAVDSAVGGANQEQRRYRCVEIQGGHRDGRQEVGVPR